MQKRSRANPNGQKQTASIDHLYRPGGNGLIFTWPASCFGGVFFVLKRGYALVSASIVLWWCPRDHEEGEITLFPSSPRPPQAQNVIFSFSKSRKELFKLPPQVECDSKLLCESSEGTLAKLGLQKTKTKDNKGCSNNAKISIRKRKIRMREESSEVIRTAGLLSLDVLSFTKKREEKEEIVIVCLAGVHPETNMLDRVVDGICVCAGAAGECSANKLPHP
jgi:hypothetical protein